MQTMAYKWSLKVKKIYILIELGLRVNVDTTESLSCLFLVLCPLLSRRNDYNILIATILRNSHNLLLIYIFLKCYLSFSNLAQCFAQWTLSKYIDCSVWISIRYFSNEILSLLKEQLRILFDNNSNHFARDIYDVIILRKWLSRSHATFSYDLPLPFL